MLFPSYPQYPEQRVTGVTWHPRVVEDDEYKLLQFGEWDIQSKMCKAAPDELVLSYTHAMMAFMLFIETPADVLIVGLGGGSLSKFCYRHLPSARITTVEVSQAVIDLRDEFCVPPDNARFRIVHADIAQYLEEKSAVADVILLDGYDADGIPAALDRVPFYALCAEALTDNGMLLANINLGANSCSLRSLRAIDYAVGPTVSIRSSAGHNDILVAFRDTDFPPVKVLKARAVALRQATGLDFPLLLDRIRSALRQAQA